MSVFALHTDAALEPITLKEAKAHLRVTYTDEDMLIAALIKAARQNVEQYTWRAILTQTWDMYLDFMPGTNYFCNYYPTLSNGWSSELLRLPKGRLQSITHFKYFDTANAEQTLVENTDFRVDKVSEPARIQMINTPSVYDCINAINIRYVCGWELTLGAANLCSAVDISTGTCTFNSHGLADGDPIQFSSLGTVTGITANQTYFVVSATTNTFKVATTVGGAALTFTGANTTPPTFKKVTTPNVPQPIKSAMLLTIAHLYEHREDVAVTTMSQLPKGAEYLMAPYRLFRFDSLNPHRTSL